MGPTSLLPRLENIHQYEATRQKLHQNQNIIASSSPPWHHHIPPSNSFTAALSSQECFTNAFSALPLSNPISHTLEMHSSFFPFIFVEAYISVQNLAVLSNSALSLMYIFATWASWGSVGSGAQRRAWRERRAVFMVNAGDHWSLSMSKQIAPVCELTFGCQILVLNFILGGSKGYPLGINTSTSYRPPS
mmetsp:Transcript_31084/g.64046  ORF Transcript_31084/g.64046 Transcript_31084/m.64046 type:complete len:190 (+) Transcript_31084:226-795(+)